MVVGDIVLIGAIYEIFILIIALILLVSVFIKYLELKKRLTLYLFFIYLNVFLAILFSWLSKIIVLTTDIEYMYNDPNARYPNTPLYWILLRIVDFRFSLTCVAISMIFSYILKVNVFEDKYKSVQKFVFIIFASFTIFFSTFIYERGNTLYDAINFLLVFSLVSAIYLPFMVRSIMHYKSTDDEFIRKKILSLALMSLCFMLTLLCFLIDRIWVLMGAFHFTIFYFLGWLWGIIGIMCSYFGFLKPKSSEE